MKTQLRVSAILTVALLAGCGSGNRSSPAASGANNHAVSPTVADAKKALSDWLDAFGKADGQAACALMTPEYQTSGVADAVKSGFVKQGATCAAVIAAGSVIAKSFGLGGLAPTITQVTGTGSEASFKVSYPGNSNASVTTYQVTYLSGKWLLSGDAGDADTGETDASAKVKTDRWLMNWCSVKVGQTRAQAIALMGDPSTEFTVKDNATPQISWELGPYHFTAFLDTDEIVKSFYANYGDLGKTDRAKLKCAEDR